MNTINDFGSVSHTPKMATRDKPVWDNNRLVADLGQLTWTSEETVSLNLPAYVAVDEPEGYSTYSLNSASDSLPSPIITLPSNGIIDNVTLDAIQGGELNLIFEKTNPKGTTLSTLTIVLVGLPITAPASSGVSNFSQEQGSLVSVDIAATITDDGNPAASEVLVYTIDDTSARLTNDAIVGGVYTFTIDGSQTTNPYNVKIKVANSEQSVLVEFTLTVTSSAGAVPYAAGLYSGNSECSAVVAPTWLAGGDAFSVAESDANTKSVDMLGVYLAASGGAPVDLVALASGSDILPTNWSFQLTAGGSGIGYLTRTANTNTVAQSATLSFKASNDNGVSWSADSPDFSLTFWDDAVTAPILLSVDAVEGSNDVYANFDEAVYTTAGSAASYKLDFVFKVNGVTRTHTYTGNGQSDRQKFTLDGAAFDGNNSIDCTFTLATSDLKSVSADVAVATTEVYTFVVLAAPTQGIILSDGFESGDFNSPSGAGSWISHPWCYVRGDKPYSGDYSANFAYAESANYEQSELRCAFNGFHDEMWIKYKLWIPSNYSHVGRKNAKFIYIWGGNDSDYSAFPNTPGLSIQLWNSDIFDKTLKESHARGKSIGTSIGTVYRSWDKMIEESDFGTWIEVVFRAKQATIANNDGIMQMWKTPQGGIRKQITDITDGDFYQSSQVGYSHAYLLGWVNDGMPVDTHFYIDDVVFSTESLL